MRKNGDSKEWQSEPAAANGILNRRVFLEGALVAAAAGAGSTAAGAEPLPVPSWMKQPGAGFAAYGQPSRFESKVVRTIAPPPNPATPGIGTARTPLQLLDGMITPSGLHFERSHSGIPDIDPDQHRLRDPRPGQAAAGVHARGAGALSDGVAHRLHRVRRQQPARSMRRRRSRRQRAGDPRPARRARNGPACGSRRCSTRPASIRRAQWVIAEGADCRRA